MVSFERLYYDYKCLDSSHGLSWSVISILTIVSALTLTSTSNSLIGYLLDSVENLDSVFFDTFDSVVFDLVSTS